MSEIDELVKMKKAVAANLPLVDMARGTFITRYLECARKKCSCHRSKKLRHGPYYYITIGKGKKSQHVYVPIRYKSKVEKWVENYNKVWDGIERITEINIKIIRELSLVDR